MKNLTILAALALAFPASAAAQDAYGDTMPAVGEPAAELSVSDAFTAMDADLDGSVTREEFAAYAGEGSETQFDAAAGDDGLLTEDELAAFVVTPGEVTGDDGMGEEF